MYLYSLLSILPGHAIDTLHNLRMTRICTTPLKGILITALMLTLPVSLWAQSRWKAYDSIYFENLFLPNFSNLLMPKGYVEVLVSNSLLTANRGWSNANGSTFDLNGRYTYDYVTAIGNAGISKNNRFNAGIEI